MDPTQELLFIFNCSQFWVSLTWHVAKGQKSVTLSSTEAEFVALSKAVKEIKFLYQILQTLGIKINLPITINVDNVGAMFMAENLTTSQRTNTSILGTSMYENLY